MKKYASKGLLWNLGQTSPKVQDIGISGPTKRTCILEIKKKNADEEEKVHHCFQRKWQVSRLCLKYLRYIWTKLESCWLIQMEKLGPWLITFHCSLTLRLYKIKLRRWTTCSTPAATISKLSSYVHNFCTNTFFLLPFHPPPQIATVAELMLTCCYDLKSCCVRCVVHRRIMCPCRVNSSQTVWSSLPGLLQKITCLIYHGTMILEWSFKWYLVRENPLVLRELSCTDNGLSLSLLPSRPWQNHIYI